MAHAQKPDFVFRRNVRVHLNRQGASVQSTTRSRGVRINGSNAGYIMYRGSLKCTGYPLNSPVSPSIPLPCVTVCHHFEVCHHVSSGHYVIRTFPVLFLFVFTALFSLPVPNIVRLHLKYDGTCAGTRFRLTAFEIWWHMRRNQISSYCVWNVMAHAQKPDLFFRQNVQIHLNRRGGVSSFDYWQARCAHQR
jgi:hypothetical protein